MFEQKPKKPLLRFNREFQTEANIVSSRHIILEPDTNLVLVGNSAIDSPCHTVSNNNDSHSNKEGKLPAINNKNGHNSIHVGSQYSFINKDDSTTCTSLPPIDVTKSSLLTPSRKYGCGLGKGKKKTTGTPTRKGGEKGREERERKKASTVSDIS